MIIYLNVGDSNHLFLFCKGGYDMQQSSRNDAIKGGNRFRIGMSEDIPFNELCELYYKQCKVKGLEEVTIQGYKFACDYFMKFAGKNLLCSEVDQELINDYILYLKDRVSDESVNSYQYKISPIIHYGVTRGAVRSEITFYRINTQEIIKDVYTDQELKTLLKKPNKKSFAQYRTWVIINVLISTGIRAKELRKLLVSSVDLENRVICLPHTKNKKGRYLPISSTLNEVLQEYLYVRNGTDSEPLFCNIFGEELPRTTLQMSVTKYAKARGVDKYSLHLFRHTFITKCVRKGVSPLLLKRITGHSSMKMLNNYYSFDVSDVVNIADSISPLEEFHKKTMIKVNKKKRGRKSGN